MANKLQPDRPSLQNLRPLQNVLGIDLGTTNTVVAVWLANRNCPEVITAENNARIIPSYVWAKADGSFEVGSNALRNLKQYPKDVCYDAKRMIGQNYTSTIEYKKEFWSFKIANIDNRPVYELSNGRKIEPEEISTQVLKKAKLIAENHVGVSLKHAVITVPAYFSQCQKQATINAAEKAGLTVLSIETEPTAAAFAYGFDHKRYEDYSLFVFDLGGGTFDITIISVKDGKFSVNASGGDNNLGGRDFDNLLMEELKKKLKDNGATNLEETKSLIKLRTLAEETKVVLTTSESQIVNCGDYIPNKNPETKFTITRTEFEKIATPLKNALRDACMKAMQKANMDASDFNNVLLIGGSSRMPLVSNLLNELFPQSLDTLFYQSRGLNPDEAVAYGAAIRAAQFCDPSHRDFVSIANVLPIGIGIGLVNDQYSLMIKSGIKYPTKIKKRYFTTENNQKSAAIVVYEGERVQASGNREILSFDIHNLPDGIAGDVYVDVVFELDKNGILKVSAKSQTSEANGEVDYEKIRQSGKPIEEVFKELAINAETDQQKKILMDSRTEIRQNIEHIRNRYENDKNVPYNKKKKIFDNCDQVLEWLDENPEKTVSEEIIEIAKEIEKDAAELIDLRLMAICV